MKMLKFLLVLLYVWCVSGSSSVRYDVTNFEDIVGNSLFQVLSYTSLDPVYGVPVPTEGESSGGAFLLDGDGYGCMKFTVDIAPMYSVSLSYWCDPEISELRLDANCGYPDMQLCEQRSGYWNVTNFGLVCPSYLPYLEISLCGNGQKVGTAVGYEYITVQADDVILSQE